VEEVIKNEDKALTLLSSLPDEEYDTFILTLINSKKSLSYNEASTALVNHEFRKKNKQSSISTSAEILAARKFGSNHRKGKGDISKSIQVSRQLKKKISVLSAKRKNTGKLIVRDLRIKRVKIRG